MSYQNEIPFEQELLRKGIHLISLSIPISYFFFNRDLLLFVIGPLTLISFILDLLYKENSEVKRIINKFFGKMLRPHETQKGLILTGATWVLISAFMSILIFPKLIAVTALSILVVSDISSAIIGRKFGRTKFFNKSFEGTLAFIVSAVIMVLIIGVLFSAPYSYFIAGIIASIIGAFAEVYSGVCKIDDNFSIPFSVGITLWLLGLYFNWINLPFIYLP